MSQQDKAKALAATKAIDYIRDGMIVGLGTGSTVEFFLHALKDWIAEGNRIVGIPTSNRTAILAEELGIRISTLEEHPEVDVVVDGADEVADNLDLIKGLGGALLLEKIVWSASKVRVCIADTLKRVEMLGTVSPLPVEIMRFGRFVALKKLDQFECEYNLRMSKEDPSSLFISDSGNIIADCTFQSGIEAPGALEAGLNLIPGIVDNGLFLGMTDYALIGDPEAGTVEVMKRDG